MRNFNVDESAKNPETIFAKTFYFTKQDEEAYMACLQGSPKECVFTLHNCTRSPSAMLVSHRDFICLCAIKVPSPDKILLAVGPADYPETLKGVVRGRLVNQHLVFEKHNEGTRLTSFALADPAGSIPAWVYNSALDGRNQRLVDAKTALETK